MADKVAILKDVKSVDTQTKMTVNGYIRQAQSLFPEDNIYYTIPALVIHWIILFFYANEQFDPNQCHQDFKLSSNNTIVTCIKNGSKSILLTQTVSKGIHKWKFKLVTIYCVSTPYYLSIGAWKAKYILDRNTFLFGDRRSKKGEGKVYAWNIGQGFTTNGEEDSYNRNYAKGRRSIEGDIIEMVLDLNKLEIRFILNDKDQGVAFEDIEKTDYKAAVDIWKGTDTIQLLSFESE